MEDAAIVALYWARDEQALMTTITALVVVLMVVVQKISELFSLIKSLFSL